MDRNIFAACGALALAGMTLSAAQTPSGSGTTPGTPSQSQAQDRSVTVTGCLMPYTGAASSMGTTGATGTAGTSGATGTAGATGTSGSTAGLQFMLTDVEDKDHKDSRAGSGATGSGATGATGTSGSTGSTGAMSGMADRGTDHHDRYVLRAEGTSVNLSQHVNHKVEITGRMSMATGAMGSSLGTTGSGAAGAGSTGAGTTGATGTGTPAMMGRSGGMDGTMPTLTVSAVKMIAASCK